MPEIYKDNRGYVGSIWRSNDIVKDLYDIPVENLTFCEDRLSVSKKGAVRGFHGDKSTYKLVSCLYGEIKLVIFDLRTEVKFTKILNPQSQPVLVKPNTLNAHQCLSDECVLFYKWTKYYSLENQWSVCYNDSRINPQWAEVTEVSDRDRNAPTLEEFLKEKK